MKAIIPAAGMGTRFLPLTKSQPKEMLPVVDKPVIQYVVEEAVVGGCERHPHHHRPRQARASRTTSTARSSSRGCSRRPASTKELATVLAISELAEVFYVRQKQPRGLGHAVLCGAPFTDDEAFYVMLGDELVPDCSVLPRMRAVHDRTGASVIAVVPAPEDQVYRYGVIAGEPVDDGVWKVTGLVEKPAPGEQPSNLRIFGRYLLTPAVMEILASTPPGKGGEIQLTDALVELLEREEIYAVVHRPGLRPRHRQRARVARGQRRARPRARGVRRGTPQLAQAAARRVVESTPSEGAS